MDEYWPIFKDKLALWQERLRLAASRLHETMQAYITPEQIKTIGLSNPHALCTMLWPALWGAFATKQLAFTGFFSLLLLVVLLYMTNSLYRTITNNRHTQQEQQVVRDDSLVLLMLTIFMGLCLTLAYFIGSLTLFWVICWMILVAANPYMEKIIWWPQLYHSAIFGALTAFIGHSAGSGGTVWLILLVPAAFLWCTALQALTAEQFRQQDLLNGLKSITLWLGERWEHFVIACMASTFGLFYLTGLLAASNGLFYIGLAVAQLILLHSYNTHKTSTRTRHHATWAGLAITIGMLLGF